MPKLRSCDGKIIEAGFDLSAFHLCNQLVNEQSFLLNDHFRCPPPIITFSNETFYGGELRIHTENKEPQPIIVRRVSSNHIVTPTNSLRNEGQLAVALDELRELAQRYSQYTIGLVAPYRAFVDDTLELIAKDPLLAQWWTDGKLIVGTAHRFQGSEVDYLIFATVAGDNGTERERKWVENANLFNVAITRARRQLIILLSPNFEKRLVLTKQLLQHFAPRLSLQ
ncbi:MAG: AAA domain-containing protein [Candidatus Fervidibacter sp.]|uniref:AAA domain-containing protein n=1 Tax=Candidatus Fervidibacter sp. TaxID=3100871 RepID=UPI00404B04FD